MGDGIIRDGQAATIRVIGVGGGGCNAVNRMISDKLDYADFIAANTDRQSLNGSNAEKLVLLGDKLTKGLGAGGDPDVGRKATEESRDEIKKELEGSDIIFITTGMGGGTGTGGVAVVAEIARSVGALVIAVVTKPFKFEGTRRMERAEAAILELQDKVDTLLVVPNERLLELDKAITFRNAFKKADEVLAHGIRAIAELLIMPGDINIDLNDLRTYMRNRGIAYMGAGRAGGKNRADEAVHIALNSPLLETRINGAGAIVISIMAGVELGMQEVQYISAQVADLTGSDIESKYGVAIDESFGDEIGVTIIATGFTDGKSFPAPAVVQKLDAKQEQREAGGKDDKKGEIKRDTKVDAAKSDDDEGGAPEMAVFWTRKNSRNNDRD